MALSHSRAAEHGEEVPLMQILLSALTTIAGLRGSTPPFNEFIGNTGRRTALEKCRQVFLPSDDAPKME
jgi:hypothetical protein